MTCMKDKRVGDACTANKEYVVSSRTNLSGIRSSSMMSSRCLTYNCIDSTCRKAADDPNHPGTWVYAIVAVLIVLCKLQPGLGA